MQEWEISQKEEKVYFFLQAPLRLCSASDSSRLKGQLGSRLTLRGEVAPGTGKGMAEQMMHLCPKQISKEFSTEIEDTYGLPPSLYSYSISFWYICLFYTVILRSKTV